MKKQKYVDDYVVIDTEINNKDTEYAEIFQISAIKVKDGEVFDEFNEYININNEFDEFVPGFTNTDNSILAKSKTSDEVFPQFFEFIGDDILIGQAIKNDIDQLEKETKKKIINKIRDTQTLAEEYCNKGVKAKLSLTDIADQLDIQFRKADLHSAINDCYLIMEVYEELKYRDRSN